VRGVAESGFQPLSRGLHATSQCVDTDLMDLQYLVTKGVAGEYALGAY
jgi:hypothetical protein